MYCKLDRDNVMLKKHYPDIALAGSLERVLQHELTLIESRLRVREIYDSQNDISNYVFVKNKSRGSKVYIASWCRLFVYDFRESGVVIASGSTSHPSTAAEAIDFWNSYPSSIYELSVLFPFIKLAEVN
ncbi:MAG: hypothetical protein ACE5EH_05725 [Gammaproteobacteria bacterium]